jgi:hypothetical protein
LEGVIMRIEESKITPQMWFVRDNSNNIVKVTYSKDKAMEAMDRMRRNIA